ncbi:MAG: hypothetical protein AAGD13_11875 [Pseudomonadota bacterium]
MTAPVKETRQGESFLAECLIQGSSIELEWTFSLAGARPPEVIWSPTVRQLMNPLIKRFFEICRSKLRPAGCLHWNDVSVADFGGLADWIMHLRRGPGPAEYTYLHYGRGIAGHYARDMTGKTTANFGGHISQFFTSVYDAARVRREWVLTEHEPPKPVFVFRWRRLIVPLVSEDHEVCGFIAINIPENALRAGLDIVPDPVFVTDGSQHIRYSNIAARRVFDGPASTHVTKSLGDVLGIDLHIERSPYEMYENCEVVDEIGTLSVGSTVSDRFLLTISGFVHEDRSFYIVIVRMPVPELPVPD